MFSNKESNAHFNCLLVDSLEIIRKQQAYILELEQTVELLQKALDVLHQNKCRTRKVKVKVYGRSPVDKTLHRHVR